MGSGEGAVRGSGGPYPRRHRVFSTKGHGAVRADSLPRPRYALPTELDGIDPLRHRRDQPAQTWRCCSGRLERLVFVDRPTLPGPRREILRAPLASRS